MRFTIPTSGCESQNKQKGIIQINMPYQFPMIPHKLFLIATFQSIQRLEYTAQ